MIRGIPLPRFCLLLTVGRAGRAGPTHWWGLWGVPGYPFQETVIRQASQQSVCARLEASRGNGCLHALHPQPGFASPWHTAWPLLGMKEAE